MEVVFSLVARLFFVPAERRIFIRFVNTYLLGIKSQSKSVSQSADDQATILDQMVSSYVPVRYNQHTTEL